MGRLPRWMAILVAGATAFALLLVALSIRLPGQSILSLFSGRARLDYAGGPRGGLATLDDQFIRQVLGPGVAERALGRSPAGSTSPRKGRRSLPKHPIDIPEKLPDTRADARTIHTLPYTAKADVAEAHRENDDPSDCSRIDDTVWFRYRAPTDEGLIADTVGSNYATSLGVYVERGGNLVNIGCDTESSGWSIVAFTPEAGKTYLFQIAGPGGRLVFNLNSRGTVRLTSANGAAEAGDESSIYPAISADGRYVSFHSLAGNFGHGKSPAQCAPTDPAHAGLLYTYLANSAARGCSQVYVTDRLTSEVRLASVSVSGEPGNGWSWFSDISADGRFVVFQSVASDLVPGDTNTLGDIFVRDMLEETTERISISDGGRQAEGLGWAFDQADSWYPSISDDGRFVAFQTGAKLVEGDTNGGIDVYVRDRRSHTTERVSVSSSGRQTTARLDCCIPPQRYLSPCISPDGWFVRFSSIDSGLVGGDRNEVADVFVHDRRRRKTERVSVSSRGEEANGDSGLLSGRNSCFSGDNRLVVFDSNASNLTPDDPNRNPDVFLHDLNTGRTRRIPSADAQPATFRAVYGALESATTLDLFADGSGGEMGAISRDGRFVVFTWSPCSPPVKAIDCRGPVIFRYDLLTDFLELLPVPSTPDAEQRSAVWPDVSADGLAVPFDWRWAYLPERPVLFPPGTAAQIYTWERAKALS